jgi:hypothetical protein
LLRCAPANALRCIANEAHRLPLFRPLGAAVRRVHGYLHLIKVNRAAGILACNIFKTKDGVMR